MTDFTESCRHARFSRPQSGEPLMVQRAYDILAEWKKLNTRTLANLLGCSRESASKALCGLAKRGCAVKIEAQNNWRGYYEYVSGSRRPKDTRGKTKASQEALRTGWRITPASMANLRNQENPKPKPTTALEQAWGWGTGVRPISIVDDETS